MVGDAQTCVHAAFLYRDPTGYLATTVPFVLDGLAAGQPVAVAVPRANLDLLREAIAEHDPAAVKRVRWLDQTVDGRNPGRIIPTLLRRFGAERNARIVNEAVWSGRDDAAYPACVQHEALLNQAFADWEAIILCPYAADELTEDVLADAARTHPVVVSSSQVTRSAEYAPEQAVRDRAPLPDAPGTASSTTVRGADDIGPARTEATRHGAAAGLDPDRVDDVALTVTELVTNSLQHGGGTATLRIWDEPSWFVCEVADRGVLTDPLAGQLPALPDQERGRGLLVVNMCADLVRTHATGTGTVSRAYFGRP